MYIHCQQLAQRNGVHKIYKLNPYYTLARRNSPSVAMDKQRKPHRT